MKQIFITNMSSGPKIYSFRDKTYFFGAYHILQVKEEDRGKTIRINVDSKNRPICWIELWKGAYDGVDWVKWTTERGQAAVDRSGDQPQPNPSLTWTAVPGDYTVYFVASSLKEPASYDGFTYSVEIG